MTEPRYYEENGCICDRQQLGRIVLTLQTHDEVGAICLAALNAAAPDRAEIEAALEWERDKLTAFTESSDAECLKMDQHCIELRAEVAALTEACAGYEGDLILRDTKIAALTADNERLREAVEAAHEGRDGWGWIVEKALAPRATP